MNQKKMPRGLIKTYGLWDDACHLLFFFLERSFKTKSLPLSHRKEKKRSHRSRFIEQNKNKKSQGHRYSYCRSEMASFDEAPPGNPKAGEKIFRTKCAQCHTVDKGAGHKQGPTVHLSLFYFSILISIVLSLFLSGSMNVTLGWKQDQTWTDCLGGNKEQRQGIPTLLLTKTWPSCGRRRLSTITCWTPRRFFSSFLIVH